MLRKAAVLLLLVVGCATTPTPVGAPPPRRIVVIDRDPGSECRMLGVVTAVGGTEPWGSPGTFAREIAERDVQVKAMALSATHMRCEWTDAAPAAARPAGVVTCLTYDCSTQAGGGGEPSAGCAKDTDCKGDRVCESGLCVNPQPPPVQRAR